MFTAVSTVQCRVYTPDPGSSFQIHLFCQILPALALLQDLAEEVDLVGLLYNHLRHSLIRSFIHSAILNSPQL